jgi:O-succinylbenzoate synthase
LNKIQEENLQPDELPKGHNRGFKTHFYELIAKAPLNALSERLVRKGALIKVGAGYADVHPIEELGDLPLEKQLDLLKEGITTPLTCQSLYFAKLDGEAREKGVSLFEGLTIPKSHFLITNLQTGLQEGFTHYKVKMGRDLEKEIAFIRRLSKQFPSEEYKLRLDFNNRLTKEQYLEIEKELPMSAIDFIEDPYPEMSGEKLAMDFESEKGIGKDLTLVIKPAVQEITPFLKTNQRLVVTSYMDHPFGQMCACYIAAKYRLGICGLMTHTCYEKTPFEIKMEGANLLPPKGTGFGFDESLALLDFS